MRLALAALVGAILAVIMLACATTLAKRERLEDARLVWGVGVFLDIRGWQRTPWGRITDHPGETPIYAVMSRDGLACKVSADDWVLAIPNELFACKTGWIQPRPRG